MERGTFTSRWLLTGELVAETAIHIVVPNANIWPVQVRWLAEDGMEVEQGETIVEFDNSQLVSNLERLEQATSEAQNRLASFEAEAHSQTLEAHFARLKKRAELEKAIIDAGVPEELLSRKEWEERQLERQSLEMQLHEAETSYELRATAGRVRVEKQRVALEKAIKAETHARQGIELLTLRAPRAGVLLVAEHHREGRPFQTGDNAWPGMTIARLPELSTMLVEAWLYDVDDGRLELGSIVVATVDAFPEKTWIGEVASIDNIASQFEVESLRRTFRVRITLRDLDVEQLRPGMSVKVAVENRRDDVLLVPRTGLRWINDDGRLRAEVSKSDDWVPIEVGPCNPQVCVLGEGLEEGTRLRVREAAATQ